MNDPSRYPRSDLTLKLHWPSEEDAPSSAEYVSVELQDVGGRVVTSMSVPGEQLLQALGPNLNYRPLVSLDGCVSVFSEESSLSLLENRPIALDQLVAGAVSIEMLKDEPEAGQHLAKFHTRLLKSLEFVDTAIASLPKP